MNAHNDLDQQLSAFLREGPTELPYQSFDAVRDRTEQTRQRVLVGPWRTPTMNRLVTLGLAAAAVVLAVFVGAQVFGSPTGGFGAHSTPTASPSPSATRTPQPTSPTSAATTLASGSFTVPLNEFGQAVDIEAFRTGGDVSGTMEISNPSGGEGTYSVDLQCARTTADGFLLIGGEVTDSTYPQFIEDGAYVVIALAPGTPVRMLWAADVLATDEVPAPAQSCSAFVDTLLSDSVFDAVDVAGRPIEGELKLEE